METVGVFMPYPFRHFQEFGNVGFVVLKLHDFLQLYWKRMDSRQRSSEKKCTECTVIFEKPGIVGSRRVVSIRGGRFV